MPSGPCNAKEIEFAISHWCNTRRNLVVPNVSWGLVSYGEMDVISVSGAGYVTEFEIKTSVTDFKREWTKARWQKPHYREQWAEMVKRYYIVIPIQISDLVLVNWPKELGFQPGLITTQFNRSGWPYLDVPIKTGHINPKARKLTEREMYQIARLGTMRYWTATEKMVSPKRRGDAETVR